MPRPTLSDIAQQADVSLATVDRAINGRSGVKERTQARIFEAAKALGYLPEDFVQLGRQKPVRLAFLLPAGTNAFIEELAAQVSLHSGGGVAARVDVISGIDPAQMAARLSALKGTVDGIALVALDHPLVREAIRDLLRAGTQLVTLASDISDVAHQGYVGIDNARAGRLAGYVMGRFLGPGAAGKVAFFAGSLSYRGHLEREMGFRQVLATDFPALELVELREVQEDRARAEAETSRLLAQHPDLAGIYNAGGATAGIAAALQTMNAGQMTVFIAHEATANNKALLLDGTLDAVIDQNPAGEVAEAIRVLANAVRGQANPVVSPQMRVIFRENIPEA